MTIKHCGNQQVCYEKEERVIIYLSQLQQCFKKKYVTKVHSLIILTWLRKVPNELTDIKS